MAPTDELARARAAVADQRWLAAIAAFAAVDGHLSPGDVETWGIATWLVGDETGGIDLLARAHRAHLDADEAADAMRCAFWLGLLLLERGELARGTGWIARAERALDHLPDDTFQRGYLHLPGALQALHGGRAEEAMEGFGRALALAEQGDDADLTTLALLGSGQARVAMDRPVEGLALLDEAMVAVVAGEVTPILAGIVYCAVIEVCHRTLELRRAREWTSALGEWCDRQPDLVPYRGQCLVHRAQVLQLAGRWPEALDQVVSARDQFPEGDGARGVAWYEQGELHRLRGESDLAERAYDRAARHGHAPEPGMALLRLAEGRVDTAVATLRRLVGAAGTRLDRARVLPGLVDALVAGGDLEEARSAARALGEIAEDVDVPWVRAHALRSRGAVLLAAGDPVTASRHLRDACAAWRDLRVPHEVARTRILLARACDAVGDLDTARIEASAARRTGRELAAPWLVEAADEVLDERPGGPSTGELTGREVEVLVEVATGKTNRAVGEALFISDKTVARHLSNIYAKLDLSSRAAATAWAYEHGLL